MKLTVTNCLSAAFLAYMAYTLWSIYTLFSPNLCTEGSTTCITPLNIDLQLRVYSSKTSQLSSQKQLALLWDHDNFTISETTTKTINVSIPITTRRNGSLYVHVMVYPKNHDPFTSQYLTISQSLLTTYIVPQSTYFSLLNQHTQDNKSSTNTDQKKQQPFTHWRNKLTISVLEGHVTIDRTQVPSEIFHFIRIVERDRFLPVVYIDELSNRVRDLVLVNESSDVLPLHITYTPISIGKLRLWVQMQQSLKTLTTLGFSEKDVDEVKGIFADTNLYFLLLTFAVSTVHLLFDALAFKNDISYWKNRKNMIGLSSRAVVWRCVSTIIIFFYLLDAETSLLVLIPTGIGSLIEIWKVVKAFKVKIKWTDWRPSIQFGSPSKQEQMTQKFDSQAMSYLSKLLYPLCICGALYSLFYVQHKSWLSWTLQSLVNGVYAFGFLFMLPQLFVNYKLKSVAHLPWRAFMYKAFNTFIDDIFAFIITMPTSHRLACFRDDLVFVVYLYQRWLYPVDKKRVNEYGISYEEDSKNDNKKNGPKENKKTK